MRWLWRKQRDEDLKRELSTDLELEIAEPRERGLSLEEARYAAKRAFGNKTQVTEEVRAAWGWTWIEQFGQDLRYALKAYARIPGFTAIAVITLALGIGATSAIFSIVDSVLLHPLPYRDPDRLVVVWENLIRDPKSPPVFDSYRDFEIWRSHNHSFDQLAAATWATGQEVITGAGKAREVLAMPVGVDFFSMLGVRALLGRTFQASDIQAGCSVVLSHRFWVTAFAGDKSAAGRKISLGKRSCNVVGIMPAAFTFYPDAASMWQLITPDSEIGRDPVHANVGVFGRLKRGVSPSRAQQELEALYRGEHRNDKDGISRTPTVHWLGEQFAYLTGPTLRLSVLILLGAVLFVLLIACVNIANLLLGRSVQRQRELAVRAALGSGRTRLFRQLLTEALLLSFAGASLGILLAVAAVRYFRTANPVQLPPGNPVSVSLTVLGFTVAVAVITAIAFGIAPAQCALRVDLIEALRASGRSSSSRPVTRSFGRVLVGVEVALSLVLLIGAGLLIESVSRLTGVPLGFSTQGIFTISVKLPEWSYPTNERRSAFYRRIIDDAASTPGLAAVSFAATLPLSSGRWGGASLAIEGRPETRSESADSSVASSTISPSYFRTMGVSVVIGRPFNSSDQSESQPTAIVNEALASKYFPREDPIGKRIRVGKSDTKDSWLTIVGVVRNEKDRNFFREMAWEEIPTVFRPVFQAPPSSGFLVLRARANDRLGHVIQERIASFDSSVPVGDVETMDERLSKVLSYARFRAALLGGFASLALVLSAVGLYGVLSRLTAQRTQEFGIRMALGAQQRDVLNVVIRESIVLTALGLTAGLICGLILTRFLSSLLYGVKESDPLTLAGVSFVLLTVAALATYLPARRAARVDPMIALRYE